MIYVIIFGWLALLSYSISKLSDGMLELAATLKKVAKLTDQADAHLQEQINRKLEDPSWEGKYQDHL